METKEKKHGLMDAITSFATTISAPLAKLANVPAVMAVQNGMVAAMPVIIIGSMFLIVYVLGSPSVGTSGHALLPFLEPYADKFSWMNNVTMSMMALYCSVTISASYAEQLGVNVKSSSVLGLCSFIILTIGGYDEAGGIAVNAFSASGLFVCILTSLLTVKVYSIFIKKGFTIKMPASVPPNIGNSFAALVPFAVCFTVCWIIRDLLNFDMVDWLMNLLSPFITGADNIFVGTIGVFITLLLWSVGLHGDNMFMSLFKPFGFIWLEENASALASGTSVFHLPHVLAAFGETGLQRLVVWPAVAWPIIFLMFRSKVKQHRTLAAVAVVPALFTIVEPVIFGLPLALNPVLLVPFILSGTAAFAVCYGLSATSLFGKFIIAPPWATPPFILGPLGTGDWKMVFLPVLAFVIGLVIYLPFWGIYEKQCIEQEKAYEAAHQDDEDDEDW